MGFVSGLTGQLKCFHRPLAGYSLAGSGGNKGQKKREGKGGRETWKGWTSHDCGTFFLAKACVHV